MEILRPCACPGALKLNFHFQAFISQLCEQFVHILVKLLNSLNFFDSVHDGAVILAAENFAQLGVR